MGHDQPVWKIIPLAEYERPNGSASGAVHSRLARLKNWIRGNRTTRLKETDCENQRDVSLPSQAVLQRTMPVLDTHEVVQQLDAALEDRCANEESPSPDCPPLAYPMVRQQLADDGFLVDDF